MRRNGTAYLYAAAQAMALYEGMGRTGASTCIRRAQEIAPAWGSQERII